jgi:hypothetical protein
LPPPPAQKTHHPSSFPSPKSYKIIGIGFDLSIGLIGYQLCGIKGFLGIFKFFSI